MKAIILFIMIFSSALVQAGSVENCKAAGEEAEKIMQHRQSKDDLFEALKKYDNQEMVLSAFDRPRYDLFTALGNLIDASSMLETQIADVRYEEVNTKINNEVNLFKMKYFRLCLLSK